MRPPTARSPGGASLLLVKIAPDLADDDVDAVADLAVELGLDGIIATNTTIAREGLGLLSDPAVVGETGGLSGAPLKARSLEVLRRLYTRVGDRLVLVGVGGIENADDAWQRILAAPRSSRELQRLRLRGPRLRPARSTADSPRASRISPYATLAEAVGADSEGRRTGREPFGARLRRAMDERGPLCVGIDPHASLLSAWGLTDDVRGLTAFTRTVVEALAGTVAVFKPQSAFFERFGSRGVAVLEQAVTRAARGGRARRHGRQARRHRLHHGRLRGDVPARGSRRCSRTR